MTFAMLAWNFMRSNKQNSLREKPLVAKVTRNFIVYPVTAMSAFRFIFPCEAISQNMLSIGRRMELKSIKINQFRVELGQ